jgi:uncharacterized protein YbjT (DUF2867 family)
VKTLVVGGTGGIGGSIALALRAAGHEVTLAARHPAQADTPVAGMPIILGSYADGDFTRQQLAGFENIVFSACNDPRQLPPGATETQEGEFYHRMNSVGVPRFVALAREDDREISALATETIAIPEVDELLSPILTVVPLQLFVYHTAVRRGVNPDVTRSDQPAYARARSVF